METQIVIDSTLLVDFVRGREIAISLISKLKENHEVCTTDINVFELYYGVYKSELREKNIAAVKELISSMTVFGTSRESMEISAKIFSELGKTGQILDLKDVLVAGICLANSCQIVTDNKKHFERTGVKIFQQNLPP